MFSNSSVFPWSFIMSTLVPILEMNDLSRLLEINIDQLQLHTAEDFVSETVRNTNRVPLYRNTDRFEQNLTSHLSLLVFCSRVKEDGNRWCPQPPSIWCTVSLLLLWKIAVSWNPSGAQDAKVSHEKVTLRLSDSSECTTHGLITQTQRTGEDEDGSQVEHYCEGES